MKCEPWRISKFYEVFQIFKEHVCGNSSTSVSLCLSYNLRNHLQRPKTLATGNLTFYAVILAIWRLLLSPIICFINSLHCRLEENENFPHLRIFLRGLTEYKNATLDLGSFNVGFQYKSTGEAMSIPGLILLSAFWLYKSDHLPQTPDDTIRTSLMLNLSCEVVSQTVTLNQLLFP